MSTMEIITTAPQHTAVVRDAVPMDRLTDLFGRAFTAVFPAAAAQGIAVTGPPFGFYPEPPGDVVRVEAGVTVATPIEAVGDVVPGQLPGGRAIHTIHVGSYDTLADTYTELLAWAAENGLTLAKGMWEVYLSDPSTEPDPTTWRTEVFWPIVD